MHPAGAYFDHLKQAAQIPILYTQTAYLASWPESQAPVSPFYGKEHIPESLSATKRPGFLLSTFSKRQFQRFSLRKAFPRTRPKNPTVSWPCRPHSLNRSLLGHSCLPERSPDSCLTPSGLATLLLLAHWSLSSKSPESCFCACFLLSFISNFCISVSPGPMVYN